MKVQSNNVEIRISYRGIATFTGVFGEATESLFESSPTVGNDLAASAGVSDRYRVKDFVLIGGTGSILRECRMTEHEADKANQQLRWQYSANRWVQVADE